MSSSLRLAVVQPISVLGDLAHNVARHADAIARLEARVVVFPELSLTGYGMTVPAVRLDDPTLDPLVDACDRAGCIALVGAPTSVAPGARPLISMLRVRASGVDRIYDKMHLGGDEPRHFEAGSTHRVVDVDGWRLGLAICKDNGTPEHAVATVELGIDVYVAGVCETDDDRSIQPRRAARVIDDHGVWVAYASFAGPTGGGFASTAGRSSVLDPDGVVRLRLGRSAGRGGWTTLTR